MGFSDLQRGILKNGTVSQIDPMDIKVFYLFENKKNEEKKCNVNEIDLDVTIDLSLSSNKNEYCLKDILDLNVEELSNKIFVFDSKLNKSNIAYMNEQGLKNVEMIIPSLRCM